MNRRDNFGLARSQFKLLLWNVGVKIWGTECTAVFLNEENLQKKKPLRKTLSCFLKLLYCLQGLACHLTDKYFTVIMT